MAGVIGGGGGGMQMSPPPAQANTLEAMLARKQQLDEDLRLVEKNVLESEESYLEETLSYGNVVKGWDGFLTSRPKPHGTSHHATKRANIALKDRVWSLSSTTAPVQDSFDDGMDDVDINGTPLTFKGDGLSQARLDRRTSHRQAKVDDGDNSD